jgi:hypothetical protein
MTSAKGFRWNDWLNKTAFDTPNFGNICYGTSQTRGWHSCLIFGNSNLGDWLFLLRISLVPLPAQVSAVTMLLFRPWSFRSKPFLKPYTRTLIILQFDTIINQSYQQLSSGVRRPGREADHSPPASAEVKKTWIYTSTPPYAFMA